MWYTVFNDLIASVQRDASRSANVICSLFSRHCNVIVGKAEGHEADQDRRLPSLKNYMETEEKQRTDQPES